MKTLFRILIILTAFAIVMGLTYVAVNAGTSTTSTNPPAFKQGRESFSPRAGERPEFGEAGPRGGGWMFGLTSNIGIIAVIVMLIVVPKSFIRRKAVPVEVK